MSAEERICAVTGVGGYLGSRVDAGLNQRGWQVLALTRNPAPGSRATAFQLGSEISAASLAGAASLIHCAYDFRPLKWQDIHRINIVGTEKLLRAAREAGIKQLVYISSISAYEGCRSLYGKAKLETEAIALSFGAVVIRPGLIWGDPPGAMFGRLVRQVQQARMLPLFGGGKQIQYLLHDQDLVNFICACVAGTIAPPSAPVTVAHEQPWPFRELLEKIAAAEGKHLSFLPVPWRLLWLPLKCSEAIGVPLQFRSDSLVSLMHQNPNPLFALQRSLNISCRPFAPATQPRPAH